MAKALLSTVVFCLFLMVTGCTESKKEPPVNRKQSADQVTSQSPARSAMFESTHKKAEAGDVESMLQLGNIYLEGYEVRDHKAAKEWLLKAAEKGHPWAEYGLGTMYLGGKGVTKDYASALQWFERSAKRGNQPSRTQISMMIVQGRGVPQDSDEGIRRLRELADQDYGWASYSLGMIYLDGIGVAKDKNEAIRWFQRAARQGIKAGEDQARELGGFGYR